MILETSLILATLIPAVAFITAYPALADMRRWTREGWHLWLFTIGFAALCGLDLVTHRQSGPLGYVDLVDPVATFRQVAYAFTAALMWHRLYLLVTAARTAARRRAQRKEADR